MKIHTDLRDRKHTPLSWGASRDRARKKEEFQKYCVVKGKGRTERQNRKKGARVPSCDERREKGFTS